MRLNACLSLGVLISLAACRPTPAYDLVVRNGTVYDGTGGEPFAGDVAVVGDSIVTVGDLGSARGRVEVDASGMAIAPGFINMLSWASEDLLADGRSQGDIRQGVTLEVFGEGWSMGPLTDSMRVQMLAEQGDIKFDIPWTTLGEYLDLVVAQGSATNVASFVGATTVRIHEIGYMDRPATPEELTRMQDLVRHAMAEGALGVGSSLIYAPANYASTEELIALARAAGESGGMYISHIRDEGRQLLPAARELITIASQANVPAEIYHFKASGRPNWPKLDSLIALVDSARAAGLRITTDMYTYPASSTGLNATMPTWVQEGGHDAWVARLKDPAVRQRLLREMRGDAEFDNSFVNAGGADGILLVGFKNPTLKPLTGKTLGEVARMRGTSPEETAMDLVIEDDSRVDCVFFTMSEESVRQKIQLPYMSFGSDAGSKSTEGVFLLAGTHPRAYGTFARLLGKYVREEQLLTLSEAIRRLTSQPAANLKLSRRGRLAPGNYADIVVFDPVTIADRATFDQPHQYATGVSQVWVNGTQVLRDGEPTGAAAGRVVRGPGYRPSSK
jgi:N-acyl-D-amino-acid deacylase